MGSHDAYFSLAGLTSSQSALLKASKIQCVAFASFVGASGTALAVFAIVRHFLLPKHTLRLRLDLHLTRVRAGWFLTLLEIGEISSSKSKRTSQDHRGIVLGKDNEILLSQVSVSDG